MKSQQNGKRLKVDSFCPEPNDAPVVIDAVAANTSMSLLILDLNNVLVYRKPKRRSYKIRPNAQDFIQRMSEYFVIGIWTSGTMARCQKIVNKLFPVSSVLLFQWYQDKCEIGYIKQVDDSSGRQIFFKNLSSVWLSFPAYNESNTVRIYLNDISNSTSFYLLITASR